ncbi:hypothetical protein B0H14DRAFT_3444669 [Mycena olivaceomarginata]|nr:hypothetical protein B0H14DRAFT_3444669 [Mycena olivaceomarginata]
MRDIKALAQLVTPEDAQTLSWLCSPTLSQPSLPAPAVAAIRLSDLFIRWITDTYNKTPETLRCLMGYIVDLTLVMDHLFLVVFSRPLTEGDITEAVDKYKCLNMAKVHHEIRQYANKATFPDILQSNKAEEKDSENSKDPSAASVHRPVGRRRDRPTPARIHQYTVKAPSLPHSEYTLGNITRANTLKNQRRAGQVFTEPVPPI